MRPFGLLCTIFLLGAIPAFGQEPTAPPPAHISFVEGTATIDHDGGSEPAVVNMPVLDGDRIRTADGRVEVVFADGSSVAIDPDSDVEFLDGTRVRVVAGAIEHRAAANVSSASAQYLPSDLQPYGSDFDRYGSWQYEAPYGSVWYPAVAADWRPYYYGYWTSIGPYGWTWIGYDRWSWPTHHYGRWGYARNRWFWIPGRTWAAAWVSWGTAPDYISWCPLGFDGRPVVALSVGYRSGWNAWTIVPRDRFGIRGYSAHRYAVAPYRLASTTPFLFHRSAPRIDRRGGAYGVRSSVAVPRYGRSDGLAYGRDRGGYRGGDARTGTRWTGRGDTGPARAGRTDAYQRPALPNAAPDARYRGAGTSPAGAPRIPPAGARVPHASPYERRPAPADRRVDAVAPRVNERSPAINAPRVPPAAPPNSNDHPAFRPRYQPRYNAPGAYVAPQDGRRMAPPPTSATAPRPYAVPRSERRSMAPPASSRPAWQPSAPARQAAPAPARPAPQATPSRPRGGEGRAPHATRGGGQSRSDGTAVRRRR